MIGWFLCGGGGGFLVGGGAFLVGGGSVCDDLGGVSTGDEVMLTSHPELDHCAPSPPPGFFKTPRSKSWGRERRPGSGPPQMMVTTP